MIYANAERHIEPARSLFIVPVGDIQSEEEYPRLRGLVQWLGDRKSEGHSVMIFGTGDYSESPSPSDRAALRGAKKGFGVYEELARDIERIYKGKTELIASYFEPLIGDVQGLLGGHHWIEFVTPDHRHLKDTNRYLASLLEAEYWGDTVVLTINVNGLPFEIVATHGYGSARTAGARVMKRLRMRDVYLTAHWYVMGHDDEKMVYPTESLVGQEYRKQYFSGAGSFQRSYNFGRPEGTYAEKLMLPPAVLGVVICEIRMQYDDQGRARLDYHVST